jgi:starvation-inducible DNA-binding protein
MNQYASFLLSDVVNLQVLGQGLYSIHWNLVSPHFLAIHKFMDDQHGEILELIDELAERIRAVGPKIPTSLNDLFKLKTIPEVCLFNSDQTDMQCLCALFNATFECKRHVDISIQMAGEENDFGTQEVLITAEKFLAKQLWFLTSLGVSSPVENLTQPEVPGYVE